MGFGDVVVGEVLRDLLGETCPIQRKGYLIGYMTDDQRPAALKLAAKLRAEGCDVDLSLVAQKPKHFFGKSGNSSALEAIYIGPDDLIAGTVQAKHLETREQRTLSL
jgi:histidyl-tRNA synthetase